jgi:hypothetical protein
MQCSGIREMGQKVSCEIHAAVPYFLYIKGIFFRLRQTYFLHVKTVKNRKVNKAPHPHVKSMHIPTRQAIRTYLKTIIGYTIFIKVRNPVKNVLPLPANILFEVIRNIRTEKCRQYYSITELRWWWDE